MPIAKTVVPLEHDEQVAYVDYMRLRWKEPFEYLHAVPNQFTTRNNQMQQRLAEGFSPGYPDLLLDFPVGKWNGLRIELKRKNAKPFDVSWTQRQWLNRLNVAGYYATWAKGCDQAIAITEDYLLNKLTVSPDPWPTGGRGHNIQMNETTTVNAALLYANSRKGRNGKRRR